MKLVIDCNVFVSAALGSKVCLGVLEKAFLHNRVLYSDEIFDEIIKTFTKPKLLKVKKRGVALLETLADLGHLVESIDHKTTLPDKDDRVYLNAALTAGASMIVTGNTKDFPQDLCGEVRILTPREFLEMPT